MLNKDLLRKAFKQAFKLRLGTSEWEIFSKNPEALSAALYHEISANPAVAALVLLELGFVCGLEYSSLHLRETVVNIIGHDVSRILADEKSSRNGGPEVSSRSLPVSRESKS